jgi:hypothetical protein
MAFLLQSAIFLLCFGAKLNSFVDRLLKRNMSQLIRGIFTFVVGFVFVEVVFVSLLIITSTFLPVDL